VVTANGINGAHHASTSATTNGYADSASGINYDRLKQELVVEFRKELQSFKGDIINGNSQVFFFNNLSFYPAHEYKKIFICKFLIKFYFYF
jgi:hypothetical protein